MLEQPFEYKIEDQEFLCVCASKPLPELSPMPSIFSPKKKRFRSTQKFIAHLQEKEAALANQIKETDPLYLGYLKNIRILQNQSDQIKFDAENQEHIKRAQQLNQLNQFLAHRKQVLFQQEKDKLKVRTSNKLRRPVPKWSITNTDDAFYKFKLSSVLPQATIEDPKLKTPDIQSSPARKKIQIPSFSAHKSSPKKQTRYSQYHSVFTTTNASPIHKTQGSSLFASAGKWNALIKEENNQSPELTEPYNHTKQFNIKHEREIFEKIDYLIEKNNLSKQHFLTLVQQLQKTEKVIDTCQRQKRQIMVQSDEINQLLIEQFKTLQQYQEFIQAIEVLANVENVGWKSILSYNFSNLIDDAKSNQLDHYNFRQEYFESKLLSQSSYYDIDNMQRRRFLAQRRKKEKQLL